MSSSIQFKRGTRAQINALAVRGGLLEGEPLFFTDEQKIEVAKSSNSFTDSIAFSASTTGGGVAGNNIVFGILHNGTPYSASAGGYNTSNGIFTAGTNGWYHFHFHVMMNFADPVGEYRLAIYKNNAGTNGARFIYQKPNSGCWYTMQGSATLYLLAGEYVSVRYEAGQGSSVVYTDSNYSNFSGFKIA